MTQSYQEPFSFLFQCSVLFMSMLIEVFKWLLYRVATGLGKVREISFFFKVREKPGNFANRAQLFKANDVVS